MWKRAVWLNIAVCILSAMPALDLWRVLRLMNPSWMTAYDYQIFALGIAVTGAWAFIFLYLVLAVTPVMRLTGFLWLAELRRALGLWAFFYSLLHLAFYMVVGQKLRWDYAWEDAFLMKSRLPGWFAIFLLVPLALTSTDFMVRWLGGKWWKRLHFLVFPATALAIWHLWWTQSDGQVGFRGTRNAVIPFVILVALRLLRFRKKAPARA
ncbi:MAG TPA: ferric reductase-like transmembrane domain-containing protein [Polyangiaceae bacterium]